MVLARVLVFAALLLITPPGERVLLLAPADGPGVAFYAQAEAALVAVRLEVSFEEPRVLAGAGRLLQELARPAFEEEAARLGGRVELGRSGSRLHYTLIGPASSFDALVAALRRAVAAPGFAGDGAAIRRVEAELEALSERPDLLLRVRLDQAARGDGSEAVWPPTVRGLGPEQLHAVWALAFRPERMRVVVVGGVAREAVLSAFSAWPAPPPADPLAPEVPVEAGAPQLVFTWAALAYPAQAERAVLEVTAELLERRLERAGLRWARAEVWQEPIPLLVLLGAGPADVTPGGTAVLLRSLVREAILYFEPGEVADARRALASRWLLESRTPEGLAGRIAEQLARSGTAEGVLEYGAALARVELGAVANLLAELELAIPLAVELSP